MHLPFILLLGYPQASKQPQGWGRGQDGKTPKAPGLGTHRPKHLCLYKEPQVRGDSRPTLLPKPAPSPVPQPPCATLCPNLGVSCGAWRALRWE